MAQNALGFTGGKVQTKIKRGFNALSNEHLVVEEGHRRKLPRLLISDLSIDPIAFSGAQDFPPLHLNTNKRPAGLTRIYCQCRAFEPGTYRAITVSHNNLYMIDTRLDIKSVIQYIKNVKW